MHPDRVSALVLLNTSARSLEADDYPIGMPKELADEFVQLIASSWGTPEFLALANPSADAEFLAQTVPVLRASATPRMAGALTANLLTSDVREALPLIRVPTLVLQATDQIMAPIEQGRYLAEHIAGATFVALPGSDLSFTHANLVVADEIAEFLTGERSQPWWTSTGCSRPCSSSTSWRPPSTSLRSATRRGRPCWSGSERSSAPRSPGSTGARSTPEVTTYS